MTDTGCDDGADTEPGGSKRKLSLLQFASIAFIMTGSGPYGIETLVYSSGIFLALVGLIVLPLIYSLPQIYMCNELSCMMPSNHGYILWIYRGLIDIPKYGKPVSYWAVMNGLFGTWGDMANYPVLFVAYLKSSGVFNSIEDDKDTLWWTEYIIKLSIVWVCAALNILNIDILGNLSYLFSFIVFVPLIIGWCIALPNTDFDVWLDGPSYTNDSGTVDWALYISTLLWLNTGWNDMGFLMGETNFSHNKLIFGFLIALALVLLVYLIPLWALFTLDFDVDDWKNGFLESGYGEIWKPLGGLVLFGGLVSNFSLYSVSVATHARSLWAISQPNAILLENGSIVFKNEEKLDPNAPNYNEENSKILNIIEIDILPESFVGTIWEKTGAPVRAVLFTTIVNSFTILLPFWLIVECTAFVWCVTCYAEYGAFLRLRYTEPNAHRPFLVPGGMKGAWFIVGLKMIVITALLVLTALTEINLYVAAGWTVIVIVWYICYHKYKNVKKKEKVIAKKPNRDYVGAEASVLLSMENSDTSNSPPSDEASANAGIPSHGSPR